MNELKGNSKEHLDTLLNWIDNDKKFGLIRPGFGEWVILQNRTTTEIDNWTFKQGDILKDDLLKGISNNNPNLYVGVSCDTCVSGKEIQEFYKTNYNLTNERKTDANIFVNANYKTFINYIKHYNKKYII